MLLIASSKVTVIIWGTFWQLDPAGPTLHKLPGTWVPSSEQKQSGNLQIVVSQGGARFGSVSISAKLSCKNLQSFFDKKKLELRVFGIFVYKRCHHHGIWHYQTILIPDLTRILKHMDIMAWHGCPKNCGWNFRSTPFSKILSWKEDKVFL